MSDLKGTINYLRAVRDYCRIAGRCERCELYSNEVCPYQTVPDSWSDDHILKMINLTTAYTELIKGMEEGEYMYCDHCGAKLKTVTTMPYDGYKQVVVRYKKCFNCGRRYRTIEVKEKDGEIWLVRKQKREEL